MAANPNPTYITDAEWRLWEETQLVIPGVRLGGIYANKRGYHNTVDANQANWPFDYSIRLSIDLAGDQTDARAIDKTMSTAEMIKRTGYLKRSAEHPLDDRLGCMREFIGTLDGVKVFCMIHDSPTGAWRIDWGRDSSHLWHIHESFFTLFCRTWDARPGVYGLEGVLSVISGETWEAWVARKTGIGGDDVVSVIQTHDDKGNTVFMNPFAHTFNRVPKKPADFPPGPYWPLENKLYAYLKTGVTVVPASSIGWAGGYNFDDPAVQVWAGVEVLPEGDISDAALAEIKAVVPTTAQIGAVVDDELDEAFKGAADPD